MLVGPVDSNEESLQRHGAVVYSRSSIPHKLHPLNSQSSNQHMQSIITQGMKTLFVEGIVHCHGFRKLS